MTSIETMTANVGRGLLRMWAARRRQRELRHKSLTEQAAAFEIGQRVKVIRDHDGLDGRWVGVVAEIVKFDWAPPGIYPWIIRVNSGAKMYASADMLERY